MRNPTVGMLRSIFAFTALLATAGVHAQTQQSITIEAANSVNNQILGVSFAPPAPPGSTTVLNTDESSLQRLESLTFVTVTNHNVNPPTFTVDLLAADNLNHHILDYPGNFTGTSPIRTGTVVTQAAAINYPNGLSADPFGNVFAVNNAPGKSPLAQVWALPSAGAGAYQQAVKIDFAGAPGSLGAMQAVVETLILRAPLGTLANAGDLLVVSQSPDEILLYQGSGGGAGPLTHNYSPKVLIPQCSKPHGSQNCIPAGSMPEGVAVWLADNSLLITTFNGSILRFSITGTTITQLATVSGPASLYKINTGLSGGAAVAFVAQSGPGNHGSILELVSSANNGIQLSPASVTAGVAAPQGIAVTNTVQAPEGTCLQVNGGCDLFGHKLNKHTIKPIQGNGDPASNIVESICLVQDPRLLPGGSGCPGSTLLVNSVCPGFDDTNQGMTVPSNACGASGTSGIAFALIKSLTAPDQFNNTYIDTEQDQNALFAGANNPRCGNSGGTAAVFWAPLADESLIAEDGVNIVNPAGPPTPTLVDITEGCDGPKGGGQSVSVFASGLALSLPGGNTPAHVQTFVQQKYPFLQQTITQLAANGNVPAGVAPQLYNGTTGCFDLSLSLFNKAMGESPPQQTYDLQDAANLLTNADTTGKATCDSIVTTNANAFSETLPPATPVYNPTGQLRWRFGNIANAITMRVLNEMPAGTWPAPVSLNASVQTAPGVFAQPYLFASCIGLSCSPVQNPQTATLSWALLNPGTAGTGTTNCGWTSNDSNAPQGDPSTTPNVTSATVGPFPITVAGTTYTYTLTCTVPSGTGPTAGALLSAAPSGMYSGGSLYPPAVWPNPTASNYTVTLSTGQILSGCTFMNGSAAFSCPSTNITGTPTATVNVSSPTMSVSTYLTVWPAVTMSANTPIAGGQTSTVIWTPPAGATGCSLSFNLAAQGTLTGTTNQTGAPPYTAYYNSVPADDGNIVTIFALCTAGASFGSAQIAVNAAAMVSLNPTGVGGGGSTQITWTPPAGATGCTLTSNGQGTANPIATDNGPTNGSPEPLATYTSVEADAQTNGGIVTITAACTTGASPGTAQLTVSE